MSAVFADRHIGPRGADLDTMLAVIGQPNIEALIDTAVPASIRLDGLLNLPAALSEAEAIIALRELAAKNTMKRSMIGLGYYDTITPAVIKRNVLEAPAWYTAYTPYQPEISQGRLEALLNFQTMICDLTGLPISGASLLDEATAAAEAMTLARRVWKGSSTAPTFIVDNDIFPQTAAVLQTRAKPLGLVIARADLRNGLDGALSAQAIDPASVFGVLVQYPGASGAVTDPTAVLREAHTLGAQAVVAADLMALCLLQSPGELGADIVVGSAQRFGVPMGFGGPHAGFMSVRDGLQRNMPGRLVGVSVDADGAPGYRLALQTREQHIRREKATSNICTAQVLLAIMASMYAVYHGPAGLKSIASRIAARTAGLAASLREAGLTVRTENYFDTLTIEVPGQAAHIVRNACDHGVNLRLVDADTISLSCDETTRDSDIRTVLDAFGAADSHEVDSAALPAELIRTTQFLTHPTFSAYHSETAMLRYLRRLSDKDYALDRGMI
ncbi:MAG: aminomethyl-transferring glycine dehydrogenase subunit GcvPA, partial [Antricoccus sp.]